MLEINVFCSLSISCWLQIYSKSAQLPVCLCTWESLSLCSGCNPGLCHLSGTKQGHFPQGECSDDLSRVVSRLISALWQNWRKHLFVPVGWRIPGWSWELSARAGCGGTWVLWGGCADRNGISAPAHIVGRDRFWTFLNSFNSPGVLATSSTLFGGPVFLLGVLEFAWTLDSSHCEMLATFWGSCWYFLTTVNWKIAKIGVPEAGALFEEAPGLLCLAFSE